MARLNTRLDRLAQGRPESGLSRREQMMLVGILARRDALFWPWRFQMYSGPPLAEIFRRQREYLAGQVGIAAKADGRQQWKDAHEMRQTLIGAGLVTATHSSGQVQSVFLTSRGDAYGRALVGSRLKTYPEVRIALALLLIRSKETSCRAVRESVLFGIDCVGSPSDWDAYTELMLPCLTCGIVTASSDTQGRACYTPQVDTVPEPELVKVDIESHDDFDDAYLKAWADERDMLDRTEPRDPHEVYIPLPATGWGWPYHFEQAKEANHEKK